MGFATEPHDHRTDAAGDPAAAHGSARDVRDLPRRRRRSPLRLPLATRVWLWIAGVLLFLLGIAGLFLPFLQGVLLLILAAAVLSLASHKLYCWMQDLVAERWPKAWRKLERFRTRVRWKFRAPPPPRAGGGTEPKV